MYGDKDFRDLRHLKVNIDMLKNEVYRKWEREKDTTLKKIYWDFFQKLRNL